MRPVFAPLCAALCVAALSPAQVRVLGAAEDHDPHAAGETILDVVQHARPLLRADLGHVVVARTVDGAITTLQVDVRSMLRTGNTTTNVRLQDGDVVYVPTGAEAVRDPVAALGALLATSDATTDRVLGLCLEARCAPEPTRRARALRELCEVDPAIPFVLPTLRTALADPDAVVVREAVTALGAHGAAAKDAADELRTLLDHRDAQIRARARAALARVSEADVGQGEPPVRERKPRDS